MIRLAVVDDHPIVRRALIDALEKTGHYACILEADNGIKFIQTLKEKKQEPDLVILDVMMPEMNGIETLRWLHKFHPSQKVVLMSFYQDDMSIQKLLSLGADGYISKSFDVTDMDRILRATYIKNKIFDAAKKRPIESNGSLYITEREQQILELSSSELTYEQIARHMNISLKTIDKHRASLFKKLKVRSRAGLVMNAIKLGMIKWW